MNRQEAIQALEDGKTLTHIYFSSDETVKQVGNKYIFEDGCRCSIRMFWMDRYD